MRAALRHPALQSAAGIGALLAFTWPLLVFDRPIHVLGAFFAIWTLSIGSLFIISRASDDDRPELDGTRESESGRGGR